MTPPGDAFRALQAVMKELLEDEFAQIPEWHEQAISRAMETLRMSLEQSNVRGCTWTIWGNYCRKRTRLGSAFCDKHKGQQCSLCMSVAVMGCSKHWGSGICGAPLCLAHKGHHTHRS